MAALPVDQHQRLIGTEAPQRSGVDVVAAVSARLTVGVERRRHVVQQLVHFEFGDRLGQGRNVDDVDRDRCLDGRSVRPPRAHDLHPFDHVNGDLHHDVQCRGVPNRELLTAEAHLSEHDDRIGRAVAQLVGPVGPG